MSGYLSNMNKMRGKMNDLHDTRNKHSYLGNLGTNLGNFWQLKVVLPYMHVSIKRKSPAHTKRQKKNDCNLKSYNARPNLSTHCK